ncbi:MAG TPA: hypothetical protein VFV98_09230 [Vicinamibacterales bacterium]|nr:hypothetical protein [Vicinamibacterales bacterium]
MRAVLWLSVVLPSIFIVERLAGWAGVAAHAAIAAAILPVALSLAARLPVPTARLLAAATGAAIIAFVFASYPALNTDAPNRGSDDDDAHEVGVRAVLRGENPYAQQTYLGNSISPMAGALLLAAPFVLADIVAAQNVFWLMVLFLVLARERGGPPIALGLCWAALLCLAVLHDLATGTSHLANGIYVAVGLAWLTRAHGSTASAIFLGVTLASRANFLFVLPCALGWLWRRESAGIALRAGMWTAGTTALLIVPFYLANPGGFAPFFTFNKLLRYDTFMPGAAVATASITALAAIVVGMRATSRASLFGGCAVIQAIPVAAVLGVSVLSGRPYLAALPYGEFAMWFVIMAAAFGAATRPMTSSTLSTR